MNESDKLLIAFDRVEGAVTSLQSAFEKHTVEDATRANEDRSRFEHIEKNVDGVTKQVAQHSILHTQHAQMIAAAQDLTLTKVGKEWNERLDKLEAQGITSKKVLDLIATYHKHPAVKVAYYVGMAIWGALTVWLASHK
jgi:ribosomal protein S12 methylthiotransferase accessory factor YcaO